MDKIIIEKILKHVNNMSEMAKLLNISNRKLKFHTEKLNLWKPNLKHNEIQLKDIIFGGKNYTNTTRLKNKLIEEGYLEYKCSKCDNKGEWNNEKLILELDHANGINSDHRLTNLRLLCPNCHSQTKTYKGRNATRKKYTNDEFIYAVKNSYTIFDVCKKLNISAKGDNYHTIKKKMHELSIKLKEKKNYL